MRVPFLQVEEVTVRDSFEQVYHTSRCLTSYELCCAGDPPRKIPFRGGALHCSPDHYIRHR